MHQNAFEPGPAGGAYSAAPDSLAELKWEWERRGREGELREKGRMRKGQDPQCLKCVDANVVIFT